MPKYKIEIEVETDAPIAVMNEITGQMVAQLESLNDGTLDMGTQAKPDIIDYDYALLAANVK
jgi:hypothetical protein